MNILIISFVDDNFGDNLIRICFESLLKIVLKNHNIRDYTINRMNLKDIDNDLLISSNVIFFAGGGLFGLSYLNFYKYLDKITQVADTYNIPVVFSSMGVNNMDVTKETENKLVDILERKCIKAVSVRENEDLFRQYSAETSLIIDKVCDPACWSEYIYHFDKLPSKKLIGINVVRGGLFKDNGLSWYLGDEMKYLDELRRLLDDKGLDYIFYTNGNFLDNNTLMYFAKEYHIPSNKIFIPNTTKEFVNIIFQCEKTISIRMHSAIVSYAFDILSVTIKWNEKVGLFYNNIDRSQACLDLTEWNVTNIINKLSEVEKRQYKKDENYLMSLYIYLYNVFVQLGIAPKLKLYDFKTVKDLLHLDSVSQREDTDDMCTRINKGQYHYLCRFIELRKKNDEISGLKKKNKDLSNDLIEKEKKIEDLNQEIQRLNNLKIMKIYKKIHGKK